MGVPKFAAWLTRKYPKMVNDVCPANVHGLYIDLNGLIHPCCHNEHDASVALRSEEEKLQCICHQVEVLVATVKPTEVMYIATDGVAPRAKMNQQRARRYMNRATAINSSAEIVEEVLREFTSNEMADVDNDLDEVRLLLMQDTLYNSAVIGDDMPEELTTFNASTKSIGSAGCLFNSNDDKGDGVFSTLDDFNKGTTGVTGFDSNCISPGTTFMMKVADAILLMVQEKLATCDQLWEKLRVVVSGANTPGEGEHKIIDFLRTQSSYAGFNGKGAHVIAGLDADLIFLSFSLHIPHIFILRDNNRNPYKTMTKQQEKQRKENFFLYASTPATAAEQEEDVDVQEKKDGDELYAMVGDDSNSNSSELIGALLPVEANTTFMYYDIDTATSCLISELNGLCQMKGFSPNNKDAFRPELLVSSSGYHFFRYAGTADGALRQVFSEEGVNCYEKKKWKKFRPCDSQANSKVIDDIIVMAMLMGNDFIPRLPSAFCGESALDNLMELYVTEVLPYGFLTDGYHEINLPQLQRLLESYAKIEAVKFRQFALSQNIITLEETAKPLRSTLDERWRQPYLNSTGLNVQLNEACKKYVEGLRFVWRYYSGNSAKCSWSWYYPFHYAPFALDIVDYLRGCDLEKLSSPPLETTPPDTFVQLLCILPPTSYALLPSVLGDAMLHPSEELRETFPSTWRVDYSAAYGKEYLATVLVPFANVEELCALVEKAELHFTPEERRRREHINYSLVLSSPAAKFELHGDISELSASDASLIGLHREGVTYMRLRDSLPERVRPKTYSCTAVVPWVTCNAKNQVHTPRRQSYGGRRKAKDNGSSERSAVMINKGPSFASCLVGFFVLSLFTSMFILPLTLTLLLRVIALNLAVITLSFVIGIAVHDPVNGSGIKRNNIRMTFVDWLCVDCLTLNFAANDKCFVCRAPFDAYRCLAIFSATQSATPPLYDPDHSRYIETFCLEMHKHK